MKFDVEISIRGLGRITVEAPDYKAAERIANNLRAEVVFAIPDGVEDSGLDRSARVYVLWIAPTEGTIPSEDSK